MNKQIQKEKEPAKLVYVCVPPEPGEPDANEFLSKFLWNIILEQEKYERRKEQN